MHIIIDQKPAVIATVSILHCSIHQTVATFDICFPLLPFMKHFWNDVADKDCDNILRTYCSWEIYLTAQYLPARI